MSNIDRDEIKRKIVDAARKAVSERDCASFIKYVMKPLGLTDTQPFHLEWLNFFESIQPNQSRMILAPRGTGKSTFLSYAWIIYKLIAGHPNIRILLLCRNDREAVSTYTRLVQALKNSPEIGRWWPNLIAHESLSKMEITTNRRTDMSLREPTLLVRSFNSSIVGRHFDHIHYDDIIDQTVVDSEYKRQKMLEYYSGNIYPMLDPGGIQTCIATRWHPDDILSHWLKSKQWETKVYTIINEKTGELLWPDRFSLEECNRIRASMTDKMWRSQYFNEVEQLFSDTFIREENILRYDKDHFLPDKENFRIIMGLDPAIAAKSRSDFFGLVIAAVDNSSNIYVLHAEHRKIGFIDSIDWIKKMYSKFSVDEALCELAGYQQSLLEYLKMNGLNVFGVVPEGKDIMHSKIISTVLEGRLYFPSDIDVMSGLSSLLHQVINFPDIKHDDLHDALANIIHHVKVYKRPYIILF